MSAAWVSAAVTADSGTIDIHGPDVTATGDGLIIRHHCAPARTMESASCARIRA
ncbi:hypothetical protein ACFQ78_34220 [Streptomyces sp. NPDC056519]|uniref:hypothetical protein n=1 Tax=Streptomyces sp. NPDC056519 TaxID=3345849 RepID=UPI0036CDD4A5